MEVQQVARRYARGLFATTQERGVSEDVHRDLSDLAGILEKDKALTQFLAAPQIVDSDKSAVLEKVFKGKVKDQLYSLLQLLVTKRRTKFIEEIAKEYSELFHESRGIVATRLISAVPFGEDEVIKIREKLNALTGKTIKVTTEVDPAIIGGVIAYVGDKVIDRSVRHDLDLLRDQLMELKVN